MDQIKIGNFLREIRKEKGMTQEETAEYLNVSNRSVSRWENGNNMPDISLLPIIADLYGVSIPELINGERKKEKMNEENKEIINAMTDYAQTEKTNLLKNIKEQSLIGVSALIVLIVLEVIGSTDQWLGYLRVLSETLVYVSLIMVFLQASGLLKRYRKEETKRTLPKPLLFMLTLLLAIAIALAVWLIVSTGK